MATSANSRVAGPMAANRVDAAVGVYGGTFDPVHFGHLRSADEVRVRLGLERVLMVPSAVPPHRGAPAATADQRMAMLQLALAGVSGLQADGCELHRPGPSYMVDTLDGLRERFATRSMVLILGWDAFAELATWSRWRRLLDLAHIAVMQRPGAVGDPPVEVGELLRRCGTDRVAALTERRNGLVFPVSVSQLAISASEVRRQVADGGDPRFLLPDAVRDYLFAHRLYREAGGTPAPGAGDDRGIGVQRVDHLVLTVADVAASAAFYQRVLGMEPVRFGSGRSGLRFGPQRINLHPAGAEYSPHARRPTPGSADLCLVTAAPSAQVIAQLDAAGVSVEQGPVARHGALGPMESVYFRDPDGNLIELANYAVPG